MVAPQGFGGIGNKEDIWIILRRTPIYTPPGKNKHTLISRAHSSDFLEPLGKLRKMPRTQICIEIEVYESSCVVDESDR